MKSRFKLGFLIFLIGFIVLFAARIIYVFNMPANQYYNTANYYNYESYAPSLSSSIKNNIASSKVEIIARDSDKIVTVDQKYEKVANLSTKTRNFDNDDKDIRKVIAEDSAVIQFENNRGIKGNRVLELSIGVHPDKFDNFVEKIKVIGEITDFSINKTDKTSEYKNLNAKKVALEKMRDSLIELKNKGGSIQELINLESRIYELEQELQNYGVQLGDFNAENELCTVKMTLRENSLIEVSKISILRNVFDAFLWSACCYLIINIAIILTLVGLYILLIVIQKGKKVYTELFKSNNAQ